MCFIVNDEDFRCDWFISGECECALVNGFLLTVRYLLICAVRYELKDLQVVFPLGFHVSMGTVSLIPLVLYLGLLNISVTSCVALLCGL